MLDEFANIGLIPKFDKLIATIRSREISASIILQSQSQLKTIYKDAAETIIGNCDTIFYKNWFYKNFFQIDCLSLFIILNCPYSFKIDNLTPIHHLTLW